MNRVNTFNVWRSTLGMGNTQALVWAQSLTTMMIPSHIFKSKQDSYGIRGKNPV